MIRTLKILGLGVVAALALSAIAPATGLAASFTAAEYPAVLHSNASTHTYTLAGSRKYECTTTHTGELTEATEKAKLIPKYSECVVDIGGMKKPATTTTFCEEGLDHYTTPVLTRTICKKNYIHKLIMFFDPEHSSVGCQFELTETDGEKVTTENLGGTSGVKVTWEVGSIAYKRTAGTALLCGPAEAEATYSGTSTVTAKNGEGEPIGFDVG